MREDWNFKALLRRPYYYLGAGAILLAYIPVGLNVIAAMTWPQSLGVERAYAITMPLFLFAMIPFNIAWSTYYWPWCEAADLTLNFKESAKKRCRKIYLWLRLNPFLFLIPPLPYVSVFWFLDGVIPMSAILLATSSGVVGCILFLFNTRFYHKLETRFRTKARQLAICFDCGYDLRGSPGPGCPECGATNFPAKSVESG